MKPYWPSTLALRPEHLHGRDGYLEDLLALRVARRLPHAYGIVDVALDAAAAAEGEIVVQRLSAILPSGLVVQVSEDAPLSRRLPAAITGSACDVYVGVPRAVLRGPNVCRQGSEGRSTRYEACADPAAVPWIRARPELLFEGELEDFEALRLGRLTSVGRQARLDGETLPTVVRVAVASALHAQLQRLIGIMEGRRGELVAYRAAHPLRLGAVIAEDLPGLQLSVIVQRYLPLLADLAARRSAHPHTLYELLVGLHGALSVFGSAEIVPAYEHEDLGPVFAWLVDRIARLVDEAARDRTTVLPFERVDATTFRLVLERSALAGKRPMLVLSGADEEFLRDRVPALLKMASPTAMRPLIGSALRGVAVAVEFEPPAAIPRTQGVVAYRINVRDSLWADIEDRMQVQLSLPGAPPSLEATLYGVERVV